MIMERARALYPPARGSQENDDHQNNMKRRQRASRRQHETLIFQLFFFLDGPSGTGQNASKAGSCNDTQLMKGNKKLEKKNLLPNIFLKNEWKTKMKGLDWWPVPPTQFLQIYLNAEIRVRGSFLFLFLRLICNANFILIDGPSR